MLNLRMGAIIALLSLAMNSAGALSCGSKKAETAQNQNQSINQNEAGRQTPASGATVNGEIKILAEGGYSQINDAFIGIARDAETYQALRGMVRELPEVQADFFRSHAVIAAFLGQRRTGGYSISISSTGSGRLHLKEQTPPKGSMTTQALTAPFKIVSVPLNSDAALALDFDKAWQSSMRPYHVTKGEFTMSGGFAGRSEKFSFNGTLQTMRQGKLVTLFFDLKSQGSTKERALNDVATGVVQEDGKLTVPFLEPGAFVDMPHSPLRATGSFSRNEENLSLTFESLPSNVADGFMGEGKLEAAATGPAPQKKSGPSEL